MKTRVAINGFGRIGRMVFRKAIVDSELEIVAVNASYSTETLSHLIKYDSIHGKFPGTVTYTKDSIIVNDQEVIVVNNRNPEKLPWDDLNIEIVIEATGKFKSKDTAGLHLKAGAKKVLITAPGTDNDITTIVMGVNQHEYEHKNHDIISNASCTTNCLLPVLKTIDSHYGIETGMVTTIHSYTNDQKNIDNPHKDLRRARACGQSIIPTTTGAAKSVSKVIPKLEGKLDGMAIRVPTPNVSLIDLVLTVKEDVSKNKVNKMFKQASQEDLKGILGYSDEPLVSIDYIGNEHSTVIDSISTMVIGKRQVKVLAWYDNEWGYSCRVVDLAKYIGMHIQNSDLDFDKQEQLSA